MAFRCWKLFINNRRIKYQENLAKLLTSTLGSDIIIANKTWHTLGGIIMDKESILKKAQNEEDEMIVQIRDKSIKYTYIVLVLSAAVFAFIRESNNQPIMDLCATVCFSVFAGRIYCFMKTKDKYNLIIAMITLITAIFATIRFFMGH